MSRRQLLCVDIQLFTVLFPFRRQKVDLTRYTETHEFMFDDVFDETMNNEDVRVVGKIPFHLFASLPPRRHSRRSIATPLRH